jgi:tyrosinase
MSDPDCAARDPIFWLHHANIDRLWQAWLNQNADRVNPIGSNAWTTQTFTFFDEKGQKVQKTGCDILNMVTQLDYQYLQADGPLAVKNVVLCSGTPPTVAPPTAPALAPKVTMLAASAERGTVLGRDAVTVSVPLAAAKSQEIKGLVADAKPEKVRLVVEGLELLGKGGVYEVYIDLPAGQKPDPTGPYFVGHISLFGHVGHGAKVSRSFDLSDEVRELDQKGEWKGDAKVTIVPSDGKEAGASVLRFRRATLVTPGS